MQMSSSSATALSFSVMFILLLHCSLSVSAVTHTKDKDMMRREQAPAAHYDHHGEFIEVKSIKGGAGTAAVSDEFKCNLNRICNCDFPVGTEGSEATCAETTHSPTNDAELCGKAAEFSGAHTVDWSTAWKSSWDSHPLNCFKLPSCPAGVSGTCYGYNEVAQIPDDQKTSITGTPICKREKYVYGEEDKEGSATCPDGYEVLMDDVECKSAAGCMGKECAANAMPFQFYIGHINASRHADYPKGCFHHDGCAYFNSGDPDIPARANVKGTSFCKVSTNTTW
jgi:hypothetical protein